MKLLTKELKAFKVMSANIQPSRILPIYNYLKLEEGVITKSNSESFVTMKSTFEGAALLDEKVLMSFVDAVNADIIDVDIKGKSATLSVGKEKMKCPTDDLVNYPVIKSDSIDYIPLSEDLLAQLKVAVNFTMEKENLPFVQCIFVKNNLVAATTGIIAYTKFINGDYPEIIIDKNIVNSIKNFDHLEFGHNERFQFYKNGVFGFGFLKTEANFVDMIPFSKMPEGDSYVMEKSEVIKFCDTCINSCQGRPISASVENGKLTMDDAAYEINYEKPLSSLLPEFIFSPVFMSKLLKSVPDEKLTLVKTGNKCYITGDSGFVSLIMEMQKI